MSGVRASPASGAFLYFALFTRRMSCIPSPNPNPPSSLEATTTLLWFRASRADTLASSSSPLLKSHLCSFAAPAGLRRRQPVACTYEVPADTRCPSTHRNFYYLYDQQLSPYTCLTTLSPRRARVRLIIARAATPLYPSPIHPLPSPVPHSR